MLSMTQCVPSHPGHSLQSLVVSLNTMVAVQASHRVTHGASTLGSKQCDLHTVTPLTQSVGRNGT